MNGLEGKPGENSIWATTCLGDVYSFDPINFKVHSFYFYYNCSEFACTTVVRN